MARATRLSPVLVVLVLAGFLTLAPSRRAPAAVADGCPAGAVKVPWGSTTPISGTTAATITVCLTGAPSGTKLLDARVHPSNAQDVVELELDKDDGTYIRSSRIAEPGATQRVGLVDPIATVYQLQVTSPLAGPVDAGAAFSGSVRWATAPSAPAAAFRNTVLPVSGDGEPSITVDRDRGNIVHVTGPVGLPSLVNPIITGNGTGGVDYWRSTDGGSTFSYKNISLPTGGGDSHVAVDGAGGVYAVDLAAANINVSKSTDDGKTFSNLPPAGNTTADRQWLATYLPKKSAGTSAANVYLSYHDFAAQELWECVGVAGGTIQSGCAPIVPANDPSIVGTAAGNTIIGNQVIDQRNGTIYQVFGVSTPAENAANEGTGPIDSIYVASSLNGVSWNAYPVVKLPPGSANTANIFPIIAVDRGGNLYVTWAQQALTGGPITVKLASSRDGGRTWSAANTVNSPGINSGALPWVVAGAPGKVAVAYVGSSTRANPVDATANWFVYLAQTTNALATSPTFRTSAVLPTPVRLGQVCVGGITCATAGDDGRSLLDFVSVDLDSAGCAVVAVPSSAREAAYPNKSEMLTQTIVAKQRQGCFG